MKRIIVIALMLCLLFGASIVTAAPAQQARQVFGWIIAKRLTVENAVEFNGDLTIDDDITIGGDTTISGDTAISGDGSVTGDLTIAGFVETPAQSAVTVVMTGNITPTGSYVPLTAAGNVGTSAVITTGLTAGQVFWLVNEANVTITISDTGILKLSGNAALGQYDNLMLLYDGTNLIELAQADN